MDHINVWGEYQEGDAWDRFSRWVCFPRGGTYTTDRGWVYDVYDVALEHGVLLLSCRHGSPDHAVWELCRGYLIDEHKFLLWELTYDSKRISRG